jgi:exopolyphosphatase/guanosine-5'-triphosphate,3'-diphosphate pyrophosphatase
MGCVGLSRRCFGDGALTRKAMKAAVLDARRELQTIERRFRDIGWRSAVGSSGTIRAAAATLAANGWGDGGLTSEGLRLLRRAIVERGSVERLQLPGLKPERAPVFAGGVAILSAVFDALRLQRMEVATGALREGVLYDQLGRIRHEDVRERTIRVFQERYHVDRGQAARVERTAVSAFDHVAGAWDLGERERRFLAWAALLHEIGLAVSYDHHHRHGAYLLSNADMPGFSQADQHLLAALVGTHRRKPRPELLDALPSREQRRRACRLVLLLRLAVLFNRGRTPRPAVPARLEADGEGLTVHLPAAWLERHPLSRADLLDEVRPVAALGLTLRLEAPGRED